MEKLMNIHPGEILKEDFLVPMKLSVYRLSKELNVNQTRMGKIVRQEMGISGDMALRLSKFFGNSPEFWLNLQSFYEIRKAQNEYSEEIDKIQPHQQAS